LQPKLMAMESKPVVLTASFRDSPQTVRMLCYGRSSFDHAWLQRRRDDLEVCVAYMHEHSVACVLVEPLDSGLTPLQRSRLAELFPAARAA
jgi:hypothetical protein